MRRIIFPHQKQESRTRLVCKQSLDEQSEKENASCGMFVKFRLPRSRDNEAKIYATWSRNRRVPQIGPILLSGYPTWILAAERPLLAKERNCRHQLCFPRNQHGGTGRPFCPNNRHCRHSRCFARNWNCGDVPLLDACRGLFLQTYRVGPNGVEKSLLDD